MNELEILTKAEKYIENEYESLCDGLKRYEWMKADRKRFIHQSMAGCVSIVMFCQDLGVSYESLDKLYKPYYEKFWKLLLTC